MKLQLSNATKSYGSQLVLDRVDFSVRDKEKIGLVGRNGCGKSTLLKILSNQEQMDSGSLVLNNGANVGYLSQITFSDESLTVYQELTKAFGPLLELEEQLRKQEALLEYDHSLEALDRYAKLQTRFEQLNGYNYEYELKSVFYHFRFEEEDLHKPLQLFSSGQKTRIALVKLLLSKPDILLLDEPTNHLDLESIEWLENYILHYPSAVVLVSHDRVFLDRVVSEIVEIEYGKATRYVGSYSSYVKQKEVFLLKNHEAFLRQQKQIEHLNALIEKFRYKRSKASFAQSKIKELDRMEKIEDSKSDTRMMKARFTSDRKGGNVVLTCEDLVVGYDAPLTRVSLEVRRQERIAIVGPNGIGKSTLVKTLVKKVHPLAGSFRWGHQIDVGYFDQESAQMSSSLSVLEFLWDHFPMATQTELRNVLARFLFTQDEVFKEVSCLSGGERVRLALTRLMLCHDNVLVLDEPTNHLDIPAKEALEEALKDYDGTILFVSHDRMFLNKMATSVLELSESSTLYKGSYSEYIDKKANVVPEKENKPAKVSSKEIHKDLKAIKNRVAKIEQLLESAQEDLEALRELRYEPEYYQDYRKMEELDATIDEKHNEIANLSKEWEEKMLILESE